ncbi:MAG: phosphomannomutase [Devosia sp.]|uniref:phosphomannomutase n=1 Tax=unclassified Devosia TaxID=196773 RepID=UPI0019F60851|nr:MULTISPECIES: phosphomannomutase [unclassified Devosia]MBF0680197.1 phosphomannomutase [Devosia sp.]WEJ34930.1 phosphomannomutase [Devosia sp. SD17-2]
MSLKFGTSGVRGLVTDLAGQPARRYVTAFLSHLRTSGQMQAGRVLVGYDLRPSSPDIARDCLIAISDAGFTPIDCGEVATPALALRALDTKAAAVMITGSHIPADRNGLKFYTPAGEISKADEQGILAQLSDADIAEAAVTAENEFAVTQAAYLNRCVALLPENGLKGLRIGVFEHSTVSRDLLGQVLRALGAETISLGRSDVFVPVDTEAFSDALFAPLKGWLTEHKLDAIVSADGDADRPLLMDGEGTFVRGDALGLLAARFLGARAVVTPVTSNSAIERTGYFAAVIRTRVGSPFVVAGMEAGGDKVVGFEANGGTFVGPGFELAPLPTRDAILPILAVFSLAQQQNISVARLVRDLPLQIAVADRLQDVPSERSAAFLSRLEIDPAYASELFGDNAIAGVNAIDGLQFHLASGETVHFRGSGNAPELRCYVEAGTPEKATTLLGWAMDVLKKAVR